MDSISAIFLWILYKFSPGALGAGASMIFPNDMSVREKVAAFVASILLAWFVAPLIIGIFAIKWPYASESVGFVVGLFGLAVARELFREINEADLLGSIKRRFIGR